MDFEIVPNNNEQTVCHCNIKENAELIAKILDYDVNNEVCPLAKFIKDFVNSV